MKYKTSEVADSMAGFVLIIATVCKFKNSSVQSFRDAALHPIRYYARM